MPHATAPPPPAPARSATAPSTRELLATLRATLRAAGAPGDQLVDFDAWAVWVIRLVGDPPRQVEPRGLGDYDAARECLAEVSARVVRTGAGAALPRREALLAMVAAGERIVVACLDQYLLQRGRARR